MATYPNLYIVGAPKCGTTSMYEYLKLHPDIYFPTLKEPNYFNTDLKRKNRLSNAEYVALFDDVKHEQIIGEATPLYLMSEQAPENIKAVCRDAKIVIMLRHPVELLYSAYFQNLYNGVEDIESFEDAINAENDRKAGINIPASNEPVERLIYSRFVNFEADVNRYINTFGRDNVHVILFDDLKEDAPKVIQDTLEFLGVDASFKTEAVVHNPATKNKSNTLHRLIKHPPKIVTKAARLVFSDKLRAKIYSQVREVNKTEFKKPKLDVELRNKLAKQYAHQVEFVESLTGRNLDNWKE